MKLLVVVDMQKDFVDGALGSVEAQAIVDNVVEKVKTAKEAGHELSHNLILSNHMLSAFYLHIVLIFHPYL